MPRIEGIAGGRAHDGPALTRCEHAPEQTNAAGMGFCSDNNHSFAVCTCQGSCSRFDLVGSVHNRRFEDVNRLPRNSFVNQNELVVIVLAVEGNSHSLQSRTGLRGMREPDFWRIAIAVELRGFDGAQRHRATEYHDCLGFHERVLHHQPTAHPKENH
jgi:hypothetical protein